MACSDCGGGAGRDAGAGVPADRRVFRLPMDGATIEVSVCGALTPGQLDLTAVYFAFLQGQLRALFTKPEEATDGR